VDLVAAIALGTFILPFLIGWWIGNAVFAAAAWGALGLTLMIRQLQLDDAGDDQGLLLLSLAVGSAVSAACAGYGGHVREKQRRRRAEEGR
jgi:hypothetical protein